MSHDSVAVICNKHSRGQFFAKRASTLGKSGDACGRYRRSQKIRVHNMYANTKCSNPACEFSIRGQNMVAGAQVRICRPPEVTSAPSLATFRTRLKTFLFPESYFDIRLIWHFCLHTVCSGPSSVLNTLATLKIHDWLIDWLIDVCLAAGDSGIWEHFHVAQFVVHVRGNDAHLQALSSERRRLSHRHAKHVLLQLCRLAIICNCKSHPVSIV